MLLGEVEEGFASILIFGDIFLIGGQIVCYEGLCDMIVDVICNVVKTPKVVVFNGTKFAILIWLTECIFVLFQ